MPTTSSGVAPGADRDSTVEAVEGLSEKGDPLASAAIEAGAAANATQQLSGGQETGLQAAQRSTEVRPEPSATLSGGATKEGSGNTPGDREEEQQEEHKQADPQAQHHAQRWPGQQLEPGTRNTLHQDSRTDPQQAADGTSAQGLQSEAQPEDASGPPGWRTDAQALPPGPNNRPRSGPPAKASRCIECGSTDTPMWRTHPVHGRGTLCNACGVKLYRQQCKDRTQRGRGGPGAPGLGAWGSDMIPEDLLAGLLPGLGWQNQHKRPRTEQAYPQQQQHFARDLAASASGELLGAGMGDSAAASLFPALAKVLAAAAAAGSQAEGRPLDRQQQAEPHIPGCQFAFRGQLPDGSIEPRAIHDVTITLHTPGDPGSSITQSSIAVLDAGGGRLATYQTAEVEPRLEYDQYLNAAVWDSRDGWWLLLPTPDHAMAFQGLMRVLAARKLGMRQPPPLPEAAVQPRVLPHPAPPTHHPFGAAVPPGRGPPPPFQFPGAPAGAGQEAAAVQPPAQPPQRQSPPPAPQQQVAAITALQHLAQQLGRGEAGQSGGGGQQQEVQRLVALVAESLAAAGPGGGGAGGRHSSQAAGQAQPGHNHHQHQAPQQQQQQQVPWSHDKPPTHGTAPTALPLAHHPELVRMFAAPAHHSHAGPVPAITKVPDRTAEHGRQLDRMPGPMPFAAPSPAIGSFPGFDNGPGGEGAEEGRGGAGQGPTGARGPEARPGGAVAGQGAAGNQQRQPSPVGLQGQQQQQQGSAPQPPQQQLLPRPLSREQQQQPARGPAPSASAGPQPQQPLLPQDQRQLQQQQAQQAGGQPEGHQLHFGADADAALRLLAALHHRVNGGR
ncbi:hypothetical protein N2152v2_006062 [Parachlorella kessleri]